MAEYDKTKFYWFRLKEDFFDEDAISWLEEQENGKAYCLFYIKLCLKSLKTNGLLVRQVGQIFVPYTYEKLAEITKTNLDTVVVAIKLLTTVGLVKQLDKGEFYIPDVENLIGAKGISAFKKQQQRRLNAGGVDKRVDKCPPKCPLEIDIELDKDIESITHAHTHARVREPTSEPLTPPTLAEIKAFVKERNSPVNAQRFYDYYSEAKWLDKKGDSVVDKWKQKIIAWEGFEFASVQSTGQTFTGRDYTKEELNSNFQDIDEIKIKGGRDP